MKTVEELQKAVEELPPEDLAKFRAWFEGFDAAVFDRKIEQDAQSGKLDKVANEAIAGRVPADLGGPKRKPDISIIFDICSPGEPTDIALDKDKMLGEAVWKEYLRKTGRAKKRGADRDKGEP